MQMILEGAAAGNRGLVDFQAPVEMAGFHALAVPADRAAAVTAHAAAAIPDPLAL